MATFNKFHSFTEALAEEQHNLLSDTLRVALCPAGSPPDAANAYLSQITQISSYTGIVENRNVTVASSQQTGGVYSLTLNDLVLTTNANVEAFQHAVLYNETSISDQLIGWWSATEPFTLSDGDSFTLDFTGAALTITSTSATNFNLVNSFVDGLAEKKHNLASDTLKLALCNAANAPSAATQFFGDLTPIAYTNLAENRILAAPASSGLDGSNVYRLILQDYVLTASGGSVAPFRYAVLYNFSSNGLEASAEVIGYYDLGEDTTLSDGETLTLDFNGTSGVLSLA